MPARAPVVAVFRSGDDIAATTAALAARGVAVAAAPVLEFAALDTPPPAGPFDFLVVTSAKAILLASPPLLAIARAAPVYVVGERAADAARRAGLRLATPAAADIAALTPTLPPGRALYLAGRDRKPDLEAALGARVTTLEVYEARARSAWDEGEAGAVSAAVAALHYSQRSAALAAKLAEQAGLAGHFRRLPHVCLSRQAAAPLAAFGVARALWPRQPDEKALLDVLESALADEIGL